MPPTSFPADGSGQSYAAAGVDIEAGERAVAALRPLAEKTGRPEVGPSYRAPRTFSR